jgi:hypothetical protein
LDTNRDINGRSAQDVSKVDCEQAKCELTGESDADKKEMILESAPESERWDPLPRSTDHKVPHGEYSLAIGKNWTKRFGISPVSISWGIHPIRFSMSSGYYFHNESL